MNKMDIIHNLGIRDPGKENKIKRLLDMVLRVNKDYTVQASDFLSPDLTGYIGKIFFNFRELHYLIVGGYDEAEYSKLLVFPDYLDSDQIEMGEYISLMDIKYKSKYGEIGHRDVLGALMGLGIKREKVGDILIEEGHVQVFLDPDLAPYIALNLNKIGRITVTAEQVALDAVIKKAYDIKDISTTVKSMRLDAVVASGFNISRSKACELIKLERVKVNHAFVKRVAIELEANDLISVKGLGRIQLASIGNMSKKERYRVHIKRFL